MSTGAGSAKAAIPAGTCSSALSSPRSHLPPTMFVFTTAFQLLVHPSWCIQVEVQSLPLWCCMATWSGDNAVHVRRVRLCDAGLRELRAALAAAIWPFPGHRQCMKCLPTVLLPSEGYVRGMYATVACIWSKQSVREGCSSNVWMAFPVNLVPI